MRRTRTGLSHFVFPDCESSPRCATNLVFYRCMRMSPLAPPAGGAFFYAPAPSGAVGRGWPLCPKGPNWEMQIARGKTCTKGLKYGSVAISNVKLTAPPEFGKVTVQGPGVAYTAKPDFEGQDAFTIQVTGTMVRMTGTSDIQVTVSVAK
jgi:hypothetical protein